MTLIDAIPLITDWLLLGLLLAVIWFDLRFMRLPNKLVLLFVILFFAAVAWTLPVDVLAWRIAVALIVLMLGIAANAAGFLGGGDVKILAALLLFIPFQLLISFTFVFCLSMVAGIIVLLTVRKLWPSSDIKWRGLRTAERYPMGISIGLAGLVLLFLTQS